MPWVSEKQIKRAKEVDLLTYLQENEPDELLPQKSGEYRTATHGSLVISNGFWIRNRGKVGGKTALDYLVKVRGMGFANAVETILGERGEGYGADDVSSSLQGKKSEKPKPKKEPPKQEPPKKWDFYQPRPVRYSNKAVAYLQQRGISPKVINRAMAEGILYESRYYNPKSKYHNAAVCVFAGKNESGKMVYAALRGIDTDFKIDKAGSDKRYNFTLPANNPDSRHLACFEAPVDLLSHATLQGRSGWDFDVHRLSLGGTSSVALLSFLERNPHITRVMLHLDNDDAGLEAAESIKAELLGDSRFKSIAFHITRRATARRIITMPCSAFWMRSVSRSKNTQAAEERLFNCNGILPRKEFFIMQNQVQIFEHRDFGKVRVLEIDGAPWFVGKDVADVLAYQNNRDALRVHVDSEDKAAVVIHDGRQKRKMAVINESGLYSLILSSKLPQAKTFKRWVTSEVLPCVRKHGAYATKDSGSDGRG